MSKSALGPLRLPEQCPFCAEQVPHLADHRGNPATSLFGFPIRNTNLARRDTSGEPEILFGGWTDAAQVVVLRQGDGD